MQWYLFLLASLEKVGPPGTKVNSGRRASLALGRSMEALQQDGMTKFADLLHIERLVQCKQYEMVWADSLFEH